ncbi:MAG TPA: glycosyl hydrolase family 79 C-terminal domain-containing protein [Solirubrobacteraceae bacterium]|nr:glycosyl hydrolase family 79 C-terminal domain-containing protein [Solirubrobacteraceae bacterium]
MPAVLRRRACLALVAALGFAVPAGLSPAARADTISATVSGTPTGQTMGPGFVGVSFEYRALHQYTGRDPLAVDPVLLRLVAGLAPGQAPVVRIGGNSTDTSWWPVRGMIAPGGVTYRITPGWLRTTQAFARDLRARLILGINLEAGRPAMAVAEARAFLSGIGRRYIDALEIGNEPDLYGVFPWYRDRRGHLHWSRSHRYKLPAYTQQFTQWSRALPNLRLAGPATSAPWWMGGLGHFIWTERHRLGLVTYHRYPLRACTTNPADPTFPSIPHLLADSSSAGLAAPLARYARVAHAHRLPFRIAEMNSASCEGAPGVSDTFASALWALDTLFNFAAAGVDGVNFHMLPGSNYELFTVSHDASGNWQAFVHPEYYGLMMFAQAFPPGARLQKVSAAGGPVKVWATRAPDGTERVTVINQDTLNGHDVSVSVPGATMAGSLETLDAPNVASTDRVMLGGQSFGDETTTGTLPGPPSTSPVAPAGNAYTVSLPPGSAALLTIPPAPAPAPPSGGGGGGL